MEAFAHRKRDIDLFGVERYPTRDEGHLIESVGAARTPADPDLEARVLPGNHSAGFESALIQGCVYSNGGGVR